MNPKRLNLFHVALAVAIAAACTSVFAEPRAEAAAQSSVSPVAAPAVRAPSPLTKDLVPVETGAVAGHRAEPRDGAMKVDVRLAAGASRLALGQPFRAELSVSEKAHVYLIDIGTSGQVKLLYPGNEPGEDAALPAAEPLLVPAEGQTISVRGPVGTEHLLALAAPVSLELERHLGLLELMARRAGREVQSKDLDISGRRVSGRQLEGIEDAVETFALKVAQRHGLRPGDELVWNLAHVEIVDRAAPPVLTVSVSPSDAEVFLDGRRRGRGTQTFRNLPPGTHEILVMKGGFGSFVDKLELAGGQRVTVEAELKPLN